MPAATKIKSIAPIIAPAAGLILFIVFTDPYRLPLPVLLLPFVLLGLFLYNFFNLSSRYMGIDGKKSKTLSGIITASILIAVLLQTIRQLTVRDIIIIVLLGVGLSLYIRRIDF